MYKRRYQRDCWRFQYNQKRERKNVRSMKEFRKELWVYDGQEGGGCRLGRQRHRHTGDKAYYKGTRPNDTSHQANTVITGRRTHSPGARVPGSSEGAAAVATVALRSGANPYIFFVNLIL